MEVEEQTVLPLESGYVQRAKKYMPKISSTVSSGYCFLSELLTAFVGGIVSEKIVVVSERRRGLRITFSSWMRKCCEQLRSSMWRLLSVVAGIGSFPKLLL